MNELISSAALLLGSSWSSGINLYLTVAGLGVAHRYEWITLPGKLDVLAHPAVIIVAVILYLIEFVADKVPYVDSAWDSVHTFIRPAGGVLLGYMAMAEVGMEWQIPVALLTGAIALDSHLTKATTRIAINTSPEPISNSIASVSEDAMVIGVLYLISQHPISASISVVLFIIFSFWFLKRMFKFVKKLFQKSSKAPIKTSGE